MFRILLLVAVVAIGYDAIVHQGAYSRSAWYSVVGATERAVGSAKELGRDVREETRTQLN